MERELILLSYEVNNIGDNKPENCVIKYDRALILDKNQQYVVGFNRVINISFIWFNINIKYSSDSGKTFKDITFPAGVWNYTYLDNHIKEET